MFLVTSFLSVCSLFAGVLAAVHLSVSVRDVHWPPESCGGVGALRLAGSDQRRSEPLDHLFDADVSTTVPTCTYVHINV